MRVRNTFFFFQAEDGIRDKLVTGVQTCALPILSPQVERTVSRGRYEQDEFRLIEQVLSPGDVVLEVGAGLGLVSAYCAKRLGSSRVFAYEANPDLEACIRETYSLNEVQPTLEMCAVGTDAGQVTLFRSEDLWASSRSEEHTSELQSLAYLVCRLLLEKKKNTVIVWIQSCTADTSVV